MPKQALTTSLSLPRNASRATSLPVATLPPTRFPTTVQNAALCSNFQALGHCHAMGEVRSRRSRFAVACLAELPTANAWLRDSQHYRSGNLRAYTSYPLPSTVFDFAVGGDEEVARSQSARNPMTPPPIAISVRVSGHHPSDAKPRVFTALDHGPHCGARLHRAERKVPRFGNGNRCE